ncbi:hypothetical protein [Gelria sp. Kuro-4]|uniref:hypothetical protein n=1 Tax=Gelria sp. Kuro-4 TaxID=2796927 RepID=UPI001BEEC820|nr:hypothetical protein [Gelria sp. Kuro-4]BCV25160.1 hypothetical protein kuro4_19330 [Gelria sp. Kuro-4]
MAGVLLSGTMCLNGGFPLPLPLGFNRLVQDVVLQGLLVSIAYLGCFGESAEETLGQRIRKARLCRGLMKVEFAQILGVNLKNLREWEIYRQKPLRKHLDVWMITCTSGVSKAFVFSRDLPYGWAEM